MHTHKTKTKRGPWGCAGSVGYTHVCSCGAERRICACHQCAEQGTSKGEWLMPICSACKLRHPQDRSCPIGVELA